MCKKNAHVNISIDETKKKINQEAKNGRDLIKTILPLVLDSIRPTNKGTELLGR